MNSKYDEWRNGNQGCIITVLGPVNSELMGITLPHEHLLITHQPGVNITDPDLAAVELGYFYEAGGRTVIDMTNIGIGRDPASLKAISERTGVHIVMGSGYYKTAWLPPSALHKSVEEITSEIAGDIVDGVGNSGIQAGVIGEIGISIPITPIEEKCLRAAARAQRLTGVAINVHWDIEGSEEEHNYGLDILMEEGADMQRVVISHMLPALPSLDFIVRMAKRGCIIEFDLWGHEFEQYVGPRMPHIDEEITVVQKLLESGLTDQLLFSQDVCFDCQLRSNGGYGYSHLLTNMLSRFLSHGITEEQLMRIMVKNPARIFPVKV